MKEVRKLKSLIEFHRSRGLLPPQHPLISVVDYSDVRLSQENNNVNWVFDFYSISLKRNISTKLKYGQQQYDFDEGILFFIAPGQIFGVQVQQGDREDKAGWMLLVHPDFFWNMTMATKIKQYEFFDYAVSEALFLSDAEEATLNGIIQNIRVEQRSNIDKFSQEIIISQIETLLNYSERFYQRQFITRKITNHQILDRMESILNNYYEADNLSEKGLPTVKFLSEALIISPGYLSRLLKELTGLSTMQHIQNKIIEESKIKLSTSDLSISEIAYQLGFEHSQSFSKMFKSKTNLSPLEFRSSFN
ncbi:helix-turn-helix domain-containing protein [Chryseobacterium indoltheticum]|uniref:Arabinose operon regulatory protein n=1 Tax=Chryseobacterium indoltheticum TaxID=254 RepID=A0A381FQG5_9FLAO|nr:helix-turn-helix transcriptional regulator [Chryseobacterium indoltheticum]SUX48794.1 Arabinose operon regulatory protein [Chryseobacterium indoltheticum]